MWVALRVGFAVSVCGLLVGTGALAKPDRVGGLNVPSGRVPQKIEDSRYPRTYYPNTERLAKDEMRVVALGTGMPNQSPSNVAAAFLVELGNGEAFLFDLGPARRIGSRVSRSTMRSSTKSSSAIFIRIMRATSQRSGSADG